MIIKLLFFGEGAQIPSTAIGLGIGGISVWIDRKGFTSATNDLGAIGYAFIETQDVDRGDVGAELQSIFTNLHGQVVDFQITSNTFFKSGGIARISMTRNVDEGGVLIPKKLEYQATDCKGVCFTSNPFRFSVEMFQLERDLAETELVSDNEVVALVDGAGDPPEGVG